MSSYKNFIQVFPSRCLEVIENTERSRLFKGREVTIAIAIATSALIIPFERLKKPNNDEEPEHIANDREDDYVKRLDEKLNLTFNSWIKGDSWEIAKKVDGSLIRQEKEAEYWISKSEFNKIGKNQKTRSILSIIRNSLAHGNIVIYPSNPKSQIEKIFFLSRQYDYNKQKPLDKYDVLQSTPDDFRDFIKEWVVFLKGMDMPVIISQPSDFSLQVPVLNPA